MRPPPAATPAAPPTPPSSGGNDWGSLSERYAGPEMVENLSAMVGCISAIAGAITTLPAIVYRVKGPDSQMEEAPNHPLSKLIRDGVNSREYWSDFLETLMGNTLSRGNGLAKIETGRNGALSGLRSAPWGNTGLMVKADGTMIFNVHFPYTGKMERLLDSKSSTSRRDPTTPMLAVPRSAERRARSTTRWQCLKPAKSFIATVLAPGEP